MAASRYTPRFVPAIHGFHGVPRRESEPRVVYRAWGGTTKRIGTYFFFPAGNPRPTWSVHDLELALNAVFWGNGIRNLDTFRIRAGVTYEVGPVAQTGFSGVEREEVKREGRTEVRLLSFDEFSWDDPPVRMLQVRIPGVTPYNFLQYLSWHGSRRLFPSVHGQVGTS